MAKEKALKKTISFRVDKKTYRKLKRISQRSDTILSDIMRHFLNELIAQENK